MNHNMKNAIIFKGFVLLTFSHSIFAYVFFEGGEKRLTDVLLLGPCPLHPQCPARCRVAGCPWHKPHTPNPPGPGSRSHCSPSAQPHTQGSLNFPVSQQQDYLSFCGCFVCLKRLCTHQMPTKACIQPCNKYGIYLLTIY